MAYATPTFETADAAFQYGKDLSKTNKRAAIEPLLKAVQLDQNHKQALYYLGITYYETKQDTLAIPPLKQAVALGVDQAFYPLASAHMKLRQFQEAIKNFEITILRDSKRADDARKKLLEIQKQGYIVNLNPSPNASVVSEADVAFSVNHSVVSAAAGGPYLASTNPHSRRLSRMPMPYAGSAAPSANVSMMSQAPNALEQSISHFAIGNNLREADPIAALQELDLSMSMCDPNDPFYQQVLSARATTVPGARRAYISRAIKSHRSSNYGDALNESRQAIDLAEDNTGHHLHALFIQAQTYFKQIPIGVVAPTDPTLKTNLLGAWRAFSQVYNLIAEPAPSARLSGWKNEARDALEYLAKTYHAALEETVDPDTINSYRSSERFLRFAPQPITKPWYKLF